MYVCEWNMLPSVLLALAALLTSFPRSDAADVTLNILHTNDVHARYDEFNTYGSKCSTEDANEGKCFGGYARLKAAVKDLRQQYPNTILLDGGDQYQGTLYFVQYAGNITQHFMNWVGYDVMAIGNHEFDREVSGLVPFLQRVNFSVVSANIDSSSEPLVNGLFSKSVVKTVGGRQVGIIGYTTVDTPTISSPGDNLQFNNVVSSITAEVERLQGEGVNIIIALGHAGYTVDKLVADIPGVDVVIGGHTNTFLYTGDAPSTEVPAGPYPYVTTKSDGKTAVAAQCFTMAKYLCRLEVTFNDQGDVIKYGGNPMILNGSVTPDPATLLELKPWQDGVSNLTNSTVGRTLVKLEGDRTVCRARECNMGNFIADGMVFQNLRHPDELMWSDVSISLLNGGSIRASIGKGDILVSDVLTVLPFSNTIDAITIKGQHLRSALEHSVSQMDPCNMEDLSGGFLQVSGLRVQYDLRKPVGQRVASVTALCTRCEVPAYEPLQDDEVYKVIMSSFLARGGDGFSVIADNKIEHENIGDLDSDVFMEYVKILHAIYPTEEGRIQFLDRSDECGVDPSDTCGNDPSSRAAVGPRADDYLLLALIALGAQLFRW